MNVFTSYLSFKDFIEQPFFFLGSSVVPMVSLGAALTAVSFVAFSLGHPVAGRFNTHQYFAYNLCLHICSFSCGLGVIVCNI